MGFFETLLGDPFTLFILLGINIGLSFVIASVARNKGRSYAGFFWLTMLVGPIIMGIVVAAISPIAKPAQPSYSPPAAIPALGSQPVEDVAGQIQKLAELKDNGILTEAEFDEKKKQLLDRI